MGDVALVAVGLVAILAIAKSITWRPHLSLHFDLLSTGYLSFLVDLLLLVVLIIKVCIRVVELLRDHTVMVRDVLHNRFRRPLVRHTLRSLVDQSQVLLQDGRVVAVRSHYSLELLLLLQQVIIKLGVAKVLCGLSTHELILLVLLSSFSAFQSAVSSPLCRQLVINP